MTSPLEAVAAGEGIAVAACVATAVSPGFAVVAAAVAAAPTDSVAVLPINKRCATFVNFNV